MMLNIAEVKEPQYVTPNGDTVQLSVRFDGEDEWSPFVARPSDTYGRGAELFGRSLNGDFGPIAPYVESPDPEPEVPQEVTRRQILTALGILGWITEEEAEAALTTGARPAVVDAVISQLPEGERFGVRMKWAGFQHAYRDDALVLALAQATERDGEDIDHLFTIAAGIE